MRILFLESNPMWIYGLPNGFRDLGHVVKVSGPLIEHNIFGIISEFNPDLIFTMGWTEENKPKKREWLRKYIKKANVPHIYWATEDLPSRPLFKTYSYSIIVDLQPNFVFTVCPSMVVDYHNLKIPSAPLDFGYHENVHCPVEMDKRYICRIAVLANAYPGQMQRNPTHYRNHSLQTLVRPLLENNIRIDFWGRKWEQMQPILGIHIPPNQMHGFCGYTEANKVYSSADFILGLQNDSEQLTQRTFEILGSGGFLITSDTPAVRRTFRPGRDLVAASSAADTVELVRYYMEHPEERKRIRQQGRRSVATHSYKHRADYILKVLREQKIIK